MTLSRGTIIAVALSVVAVASAFTARALPRLGAHATSGTSGTSRLAALQQTVLPSTPRVALRLPSLTTGDGTTFSPAQLRGHWSLVFFGYTACPDVCPMTLMVLSDVAKQAASGVADGRTQLLFVSVQPEGDTPPRVKSYLAHFDRALVGLTGARDSVAQFARAVGAASDSSKSGIDHSTSLFVIDPDGKLAGVLLRPSNAARVIEGLNTLRASSDGASHDQ
jgi:protein SCO1/2